MEQRGEGRDKQTNQKRKKNASGEENEDIV